jgi:hypothetical protein
MRRKGKRSIIPHFLGFRCEKFQGELSPDSEVVPKFGEKCWHNRGRARL